MMSVKYIILVILFITIVQAKFYRELGWEKIEHTGSSKQSIPDEPIQFRVFIKQQNVDMMESYVRLVTDPKSSQYGKYLSIDEITELFEPTQKSIKVVDRWIKKHHPISVEYHSNRDSVRVTMMRSNVEQMFGVKMERYQHPLVSHRVIYRSQVDPVLNDNLLDHIDLITGISHFPVINNSRKRVNNQLAYKQQQEELFSVSSSSDSSSAASSSSAAPVGLTILEIKGFGDYLQVTFSPACSPNCQPIGKTISVSVYVNSVNQVNVDSVSTLDINPTCSQSTVGHTVCTANAKALNYIPTTVYITDAIGNTALYAYQFVSTPVILPQSIKSLYGIPQGYIVTNASATQCVVEFEQQYYSQDDLISFFNQMGLPTTTPVNVIGFNNQSNPGVEASLDIQYIMGVATGSPTTFWSIYANSTVEIDDILTWELAMTQAENPPLVNSLSYGMSEVNVDKYQGAGYLARSDVEFGKLALRGVTVIIACGDSGSSDLGAEPMSVPNCKVLHADWPSQSPYVVAVGSTYVTPLAEPICYTTSNGNSAVDCQFNPLGEISVSVDNGLQWTTGGGISNTSSRPWYQNGVVETYFDNLDSLNLLPPARLYNASGRSYPDVATIGHNLYVVNGGQYMTVDGTSASAPIFGGLVTILNDIRLNAGKPPLGFINPLLYQIAAEHPGAFYDVVVGHNRCGIVGFDPTCCPFGWSATPGFDQTSGLGRPNMEVLIPLILNY